MWICYNNTHKRTIKGKFQEEVQLEVQSIYRLAPGWHMLYVAAHCPRLHVLPPRLSPDDQQQRLARYLTGQEEHEALEQRSAHRGLVVDVDAKRPTGRLLALLAVIAFVVIAIVAHILVWAWRPWIPGPKGYAMLDGATAAAHHLLSLVS